MEIRGQEVKPGILRLEMGIVPFAGGIHTIGAIKVFAEPSHTLLFAAADPVRLGDGGLAAITTDHPAARVEGDLGTDGTRVSHTVRDVAVGRRCTS
jgi:hypothetical protein